MLRDKSYDGVFLHNFFKDYLEYFTRTQPVSYETFHFYFSTIKDEWIPLKKQIETYPQISSSLRKDLETLFDLAQEFFYEILADEPTKESKIRMGELWTKIRGLAVSIRCTAKSQKLYTDGLYSGIVNL